MGQTIYQWTNAAGGSWAAGANWSPAGPAGGTDVVADFGTLDLAADATVTLDGARTIGQLRFADTAPSHNWFLNTGSGGPLTLDVSAGASIIAVSNQTATISVLLAGTKGLMKTGRGTLVLTGANTYTGNTTNVSGTLILNGATGHITDTSGLTFSGSSTFNLDNVGADGAINETIGQLYFLAGEGTVKSTRTEAQSVTLTTAYNNHALGSSGNFITAGGVSGTDNKIIIGNKSGFLSGRHAFNGTNFVWVDTTVVRGINYGTDANTVTVGAGATLGSVGSKHVKITGAITAQTNITVATLNIAGPYDFTLSSGTTFTFINGILKAGGGASTFSGGTTINDSNAELPIRVDAAGDSLAINTKITGGLTLTKAGAGLLSLGSAANDFTGSIYVDNGTLRLGAANVIPFGVGKGNMILADLGIFDVGGIGGTINGLVGSGGVDNLVGAGSYTLAVGSNDQTSAFSGVIRNTSGSLALNKVGVGTLTLSGSNSFSGGVLVQNGVVALVHGAAAGTGMVNVTGSGQALLQGDGLSVLNAATLNGGGFTGDGTLKNPAGNNTWSGLVTLAADARINVTGGSLTLPNLTGSFAIRKQGAGALVLPNATPLTLVRLGLASTDAGGVIKIGNDASLGAGLVTFDTNSSPTLQSLDATSHTLANGLAWNTANAVKFGVVGSGNLLFNGGVTLGTNAIADVGNANTTFSNGVSGAAFSLTKQGPGTLTLAGTNAYSGDTTINAGPLAFVGTAANSTNFVLSSNATLDVTSVSGEFALASGKTLKGNGSVVGAVTIAGGATLSPGASIGTLAFSTNLILNGSVVMEIGKTNSGRTNDLVTSAATLAYGGTLTVTATGDALVEGDTFKLFHAAAYSNSFAVLNLPNLDPGLAWSAATLALDGTLRVVGSGTTPIIGSDPQSQTAQLCGSVNFSVLLNGAPPLYCFWYQGPSLVSVALTPLLTLSNLTPAQAGDYILIVSNSYGMATSAVAHLTLADTQPPTLICPAPQTLTPDTNCQAILRNLTGLLSTSDCSLPLTITQSPPAGTSVGFGTTTVTFTVRDASNNVAACTTTVTLGNPATPVTRIMPLGDSITQGTVPGGYRARLWQLLTNAGFKVDFVGTLSNNTAASLPDPQHEGHSGWMINQIDANILSYLDAVDDPDLILLLLGTNDYKLDNDPTNAIHRLEALIAKIATKRPFAKIVVANLLLRTDYPALNDTIQATFNPLVPGVVSNQAALGRQVFFLDLRSAVGAADLADGLHPNQSGYDKMADSWFSAITNLATPQGGLPDVPAIADIAPLPTRSGVVITFSKSVTDCATNFANFNLGGGLTLLGATLDPVTLRSITLTTSLQVPNTTYSITESGIRDRTATANLMPTTTTNFTSAAMYGPLANVPEAANYTLLYSLVIPNTANFHTNGTPYTLDHHLWLSNFSRIAYYVELQQPNGPLQYLWVAMDAFTPNAGQLGVPSGDTGAFFQQSVANMDVRSSVPGIVTGTNLSGGYIEFWPGNYAATNLANVPGASSTTLDWGDSPVAGNGYGSMQIHNVSAGQVLFAFNHWGGGTIDLGIGNNVGNANPDWTFMANAASYSVKRLLVYVLPNANPAPVDADVVVYGGTSGGVAAAVQAARIGKRAVLVCYDNHIGGLSSGGLGQTDTGNTATIGGISREFYTRIGQYYGGGIRYTFEPHAAEQTYAKMLAEAGVQVVFRQRLASATKNGARITSITMTNGAVFRGKMFVDTTYEGDLLAAAGVSFTVGREGTNVYGESLNGIRNGAAGHQFSVNVDPYVVPGNPASGLLPYIQSGTGGTVGDGDTRVQAYNFRLCLTKTAGNQLPIQPPANYDPANYELLGRFLAARVAHGDTLTVSSFMNPSGMPNGKTDVNNNGAFSSDFIGMNYDYPTADYATRAAMWQAHEDYIRGFLTYLATEPRAPASLRAEMQSWALSLDEFLDTGGWPHAMYVREGRRMVSDYVMTQDNCALRRIAADSVGLASYNMDSHNCQRIVKNGYAYNEGDVQSAPAGPFQISYRSIVPRASECENLFATFALSGSHIAFSSCRMEPVFMMTSQSAGAAACFAIDDNVPVQQVNYDKLALQLQVDGQILVYGATSTGGLTVDNADSTGVAIVGAWTASTATAGFYGANYIHDGNADKGTKSVTFTPTLPTNDVYGVYMRWAALDNRAASVPVDIIHPAGTNTVFINQQINGGIWNLLLTTNFTAGTNARVVIRTDGTSGYVLADAVQFVSASGAALCTVQVVATDGTTSELGGDPARVMFVRSGDTSFAVTVNYTLGGTASNGVDYAALSGSITIPAGATTNSLVITALPDSVGEGNETIVLTLAPGTGYGIGAQSSANVTITEPSAPVLLRVLPTPGTGVRLLAQIEVQFTEDVAGVDAGDLLINGVPATNLLFGIPGQFIFQFAPSSAGLVNVAWAVNHGIQDLASPPNPFVGSPWSYTVDPTLVTNLFITEFMAANKKATNDVDGDASDWIEIWNGSSVPVDLGGWFLTDTATNLTKWAFPHVTLAANGYLLVFASGKNRTDPAAQLHTNFKLEKNTGFLALIAPDGTNIASGFPAYPAQQTDVSYGRDRLHPELLGYFTKPTPGQPNAVSGAGFAGNVTFSRGGGTFLDPFQLALTMTASNAGAQIYYTLDGTLPSTNSALYAAPLMVTNSTRLRAQVFAPGLWPGEIRSEHFICLDAGVLSFSSDLPLMVLHNFGAGAVPATTEQFVYMAEFDPGAGGRSSLAATPDLDSRGRFKVRGRSTGSYPKSNFAYEAWDEFDTDKDIPLLGLPEDSDWVLYAPDYFDQVMLHNPLAHQLSRDMGRYSSRTRFVEVFLNTTGGAVAMSNYYGIYVLEEKIKRRSSRVDIAKLEPQQTTAPQVTGGYVLKLDQVDTGETTFTDNFGRQIIFVEPSSVVTAQAAYISNYFRTFETVLSSPSYADPVTGYAAYIDVDSWIDHHIMQALAFNVDAFRLSGYFFKDRDKKIEMGPNWDFDRSQGTGGPSGDNRAFNPRLWRVQATGDQGSDLFGVGPSNLPTPVWWSLLFRDPEFWQKWIDRWTLLRQDVFSTNQLLARVDALANQVREAQPRTVARWAGQGPSDLTPRSGTVSANGYSFNFGSGVGYQAEVDFLKQWFADRVDFMDTNFVRPPAFSTNAGPVTPSYPLVLTSAPGATIYYTLDGTDPRLSGGGVSPAALSAAGTVTLTVTNNLRVFARAYDAAHDNMTNAAGGYGGNPLISSHWSGPSTATFVVQTPAFVVTEIMYHPAKLPGDTNDVDAYEFIELRNVGATMLNLVGFRFTNGIQFTFAAINAVTSLAPGERVVLVANLAAFLSRYSGVTNVAGEYTGNLDNAGERLTLVGPAGEVVQDLTYHDSWYPITDGAGFSLVIADDHAAPGAWNLKSGWRPCGTLNGTPGSDDPGALSIAPVLVNEVLSASVLPAVDAVELSNPTSTNVDISGWFLTDDFGTPNKFRVPDGTVLQPLGYAVFDETAFNPGGLGFAFDSAGDQVWLFSADASAHLSGYVHGFSFGPAEAGVSFGSYRNSQGEEHFVAQTANTLGTNNASPLVGPVVISEFMYHPLAASSNDIGAVEFIELQNLTTNAVSLYDPAHPASTWHLRNAVDFDFPPGLTLAPRGRLLVVGFDPGNALQLAAFRARYAVTTNVPILGPWSGALDNAGETIELRKPAPPKGTDTPYILVEEVAYNNTAPWPMNADGLGASLQRVVLSAYGNDPTNWLAAAPTAGAISPWQNRAPVATDKFLGALQNQSTALTLAALLQGATDPDGDLLAVSAVSTTSTNGGTVTLVGTNILYQPVAGFLGADSFTYTLSDGQGGAATAIVLVSVISGEGFNVIHIDGSTGPAALRFSGVPYQGYAIQRSTNLTDWVTITNLPASATGTLNFQDPAPPSGQAFYRISAP